MAIPIALVMALLPAGWGCARLAGGGLALALFSGLHDQTTENRVVKAGYPAGTATAHREAALGRQQRETDRKRAAAAERAARYRERTGR